MASHLSMSADHVNNVFITAVNRIGEEDGGCYLSYSLIASTNGWPIGKVASPKEQAILYADIDLACRAEEGGTAMDSAPPKASSIRHLLLLIVASLTVVVGYRWPIQRQPRVIGPGITT